MTSRSQPPIPLDKYLYVCYPQNNWLHPTWFIRPTGDPSMFYHQTGDPNMIYHQTGDPENDLQPNWRP